MFVRPGSLRGREVQVPGAQADFACCDRCVNLTTDRPATLAGSGSTETVSRRRLLKAAVSRRAAEGGDSPRVPPEAGQALSIGSVTDSAKTEPADFANVAQQPRTVWGTVYDVSPHVLVIGDVGREQRFILTPDAVAWRGHQVEPVALSPTGSGPTSAG